jgi:hypothetical protein
LLLALTSLAMWAAAAPPVGADVIVSADRSAKNVSAYGGAQAWSRRAPTGEYRLVVRQAGVVRDAAVSPFSHPVDADLGPGRRGGVVAVYTRCSSSRRCDLFQLSLGSGRERRLRSLAGGRPKFVPSTWRGRYVFGRAARVFGGATPSRTRRFRRAGVFKTSRLGQLTRRLPYGTDLRGRRVAYITNPWGLSSVRTQLFGRRRRGRDCELKAFANRDSSEEHYFSPVLHGDYVYWLEDDNGAPVADDAPDGGVASVHRRRLPSRRCRQRGDERSAAFHAHPKYKGPDAIAIDRGYLFYTGPDGVRQTEFSRLNFCC